METEGQWTQEATDYWAERIRLMTQRKNLAAQKLVQAGGVFLASALPDTRPDELEPRESVLPVDHGSAKHPTPWVRRAARVLLMVHELHRLGYQLLRVEPTHPCGAGLWWRVSVAPAHLFRAD